MDKIKEFIKANKWYIVAYFVFIILFWFIYAKEMTAAEAYIGLLLMHAVFACGVYVVKKIQGK